MLQAFIDESGVSGESGRSSKHFVLGAFVFDDDSTDRARQLLAGLRTGTNRAEGHELSWKRTPNHGARRYMTQTLGEQDWARYMSVVVCRDLLTDSLATAQLRYQYTLRFLLERLSWFARTKSSVMHLTISHLRGMRVDDLPRYLDVLRSRTTEIKWRYLDSAGITVDNNRNEELLQLGDIVASSTACAFEPDEWGFTEPDYLRRTLPRFYRHNGNQVLRYGLKFHPNSAEDQEPYSWLRVESEP